MGLERGVGLQIVVPNVGREKYFVVADAGREIAVIAGNDSLFPAV